MKSEEDAFEWAKRDIPFRYLGQVRCIIHKGIQDSKIEVFDEMDNIFRDLKSRYPTITEQQILSAFERIKKRHLSILQK
jgi:hypothetical protein